MTRMDFITINLSDWATECQLCGKVKYLTHAVPYYEEPRPDLEIGDIVPGGSVDDEVGGMTCCKACHDSIYGEYLTRSVRTAP